MHFNIICCVFDHLNVALVNKRLQKALKIVFKIVTFELFNPLKFV